MLHIFFNYTELHRLKEAVFVLHMVNVGLELDSFERPAVFIK